VSLIEISPLQLALCAVFVAVAGTGSAVLRLGLEKDLAWGTVRTFAQLFLVGYVLKFVFQINNPFLVLLIFAWMVFWAAHAIRGRVGERQVAIFAPTFLSMVASYTIVAVAVTAFIIQVDPWYSPQYFIPLGGMIAGNSMNAITIALERMFTELRRERSRIELTLSLGATYQEGHRRYSARLYSRRDDPLDQRADDGGAGLFAGDDDGADPGRCRPDDLDQIPDHCDADVGGVYGDWFDFCGACGAEVVF